MTWTKIISPTAPVKGIRAGFFIPVGRGNPHVLITIPTTLGGKAWDKIDRCDAYWGEGENKGKLKLDCVKDGQFKIKRLKHCLSIHLPDNPAFSREDRALAEVPYVIGDGNDLIGCFILTVPDWTIASYRKTEVRDEPHDDLGRPVAMSAMKPDRLQIAGSMMVCNNSNVRLTGQEANVMQALIANWGSVVSRDELYRAGWGKDGTSDPKRLETCLGNLRGKIQTLPIEIFNRHGQGWLLGARRAEAA